MKNKIRFILITLMTLAVIFVGFFGYKLYKENQYIATVMIDAGHGGYDVGSIGVDGTYEKDLTLSIALKTGAKLKELNPNIKVVYTRTNDIVDWANNEVDDLIGRIQKSIDEEADYYLSIHLNANENTEAYGYNAFIRSNDEISQEIAETIEKNLINNRWSYNRGIEYTDFNPLYVVDNQNIPSILFEAGFITNPIEFYDLKKSSNQDLIAQSLASAYNDYILSTIEDNQ